MEVDKRNGMEGEDAMSWMQIIKVIPQLMEHPEDCPKGQRWCPKCQMCEPLDIWRKHNELV